jgi:hypothetical protein
VATSGPDRPAQVLDPPARAGSASAVPAADHKARWIGAAITALVLIAGVVVFDQHHRVRLTLSRNEVPDGETYEATASGFRAAEPIRFSWTGPTHGVMMPRAADSHGTTIEGPILERDPPGRYVILATGLRSGRQASSALRVLPDTPPAR